MYFSSMRLYSFLYALDYLFLDFVLNNLPLIIIISQYLIIRQHYALCFKVSVFGLTHLKNVSSSILLQFEKKYQKNAASTDSPTEAAVLAVNMSCLVYFLMVLHRHQ